MILGKLIRYRTVAIIRCIVDKDRGCQKPPAPAPAASTCRFSNCTHLSLHQAALTCRCTSYPLHQPAAAPTTLALSCCCTSYSCTHLSFHQLQTVSGAAYHGCRRLRVSDRRPFPKTVADAAGSVLSEMK